MTDAKKPMAEANRISSMLNTVLGADRFPVKVDELALEYSRQCFADSPIDTVRGEDLDGFDGLLKANKARSKWLVLYNSATPSEGRKRFTIAHEFGHYILHRHQQDLFECGDDDIETGDNNERDIEAEADLFASTLLMVDSLVTRSPRASGWWKRSRPPAHMRRGSGTGGRKPPLAGWPSRPSPAGG